MGIKPKDPKRCTKCGEHKPRSEFSAHATAKNGVQSQCKPCSAEIARNRWASADKEKTATINRRSKLKCKYGISLEDYDAMLKLQGGGCAICGTTSPTGKSGQFGPVFHVDHSHKTGQIRGLLCNLCNVGIGALRDSSDLLIKATKYLEKFNGVRS